LGRAKKFLEKKRGAEKQKSPFLFPPPWGGEISQSPPEKRARGGSYLLRPRSRSPLQGYESGEGRSRGVVWRKNSLFGVLSLLTGQTLHRSITRCLQPGGDGPRQPATSVRRAIEQDASAAFCCLPGLSSRILQTKRMIENLNPPGHVRPRLVSFSAGGSCRDFGVPVPKGSLLNLRLSHQIKSRSDRLLPAHDQPVARRPPPGRPGPGGRKKSPFHHVALAKTIQLSWPHQRRNTAATDSMELLD